MIEHDREEKGVAAKVLQFYVPCWLDSAKCPPLQYRLMEIVQRGDSKPSSDDSEFAKAAYEGVKVGKITEQVDFEEKDEFPTMLSDMDPKTMGLSVAINRGNQVRFGPVAELLPLENPVSLSSSVTFLQRRNLETLFLFGVCFKRIFSIVRKRLRFPQDNSGGRQGCILYEATEVTQGDSYSLPNVWTRWQDGYFELRALAESGSTFRFLVSTSSCPLEYAKTKVITFGPLSATSGGDDL